MKLGILTYTKQPDLYFYDQPLIPLFAKEGIHAVPIIWNQPNVDWKSFNALLIRSIWDYYLDEEQFTGWLEEIKLLGIPMLNPIEAIFKNKHKFYLQTIQDKGIDIIPTLFIEKESSFPFSEIVDRNWEKFVVKPAFSAGSFQTKLYQISDFDQLNNELIMLLNQHDLLIQKFMPEVKSSGEISLIFFQNEFQYAVIKTPKSGDFRVQSEFGGHYQPYSPEKS